VWAAIATTNFDLLIEKTYDRTRNRLQTPVIFIRDGERVEEKLRTRDSVIYFKLHGCITDINNPSVPLILTPDQYVTHMEGRSRLFEKFKSYAYEYPILFVGQSLGDNDLRQMLNELSKLEGTRPRYYILSPQMTDAEVRFWEGKRITYIKSTFENLLTTLDAMIPSDMRVLSTMIDISEDPISRKYTSGSSDLSESLQTFLSRDVEFVHKDIKPQQLEAKDFYKGFCIDWSPIIYEYDVKRSIVDNILSEVFLIEESERIENTDFHLLEGFAGSGKSITLRRIAWDASVTFNKLCLFVNQSSFPEYEPLKELYRKTQERIFLFIDPVSDYVMVINDFITKARKDKLPITIIGAERFNDWNNIKDELDPLVTHYYELKKSQ